MTEQKAKFGVLVQRGKEQYVIEGKEHALPPELAPSLPPAGWKCEEGDLNIGLHDAPGQTCPYSAHLYKLCWKEDDSASINFGILPKDEDPIIKRIGRWEFDINWVNRDKIYGYPNQFYFIINAWGDFDKFEYFTGDENYPQKKEPNITFRDGCYSDNILVRFNPLNFPAGNYTAYVNVALRLCLGDSCFENCTFTKILPDPFHLTLHWTLHGVLIDRMLEPYKYYDFGTLRIYESKEADFKVKNNIDKELNADIWIDGPDALDFDIIEGPKGKVTLQPHEQKNIKIKWNPQVLGNQTAKLNISCDNGYWDYCYLLGCSEKPPCAYLYIYPPGTGRHATEYSWGELLVGQSETKQFAVRNFHRENQIVNIKLHGDSDFRITGGGGIQELESNLDSEELETHYVSIEFSPTSPGEKTAYLVLEPCNASMLIKGSGKSAVVFDSWEYNFGAQKIGYYSDTVPFNIKNIGDENAEVSVSIQGDMSKNFELVEGFEDTLYSGSQETVRVRFCPVEQGDLKAYLCAEVKAEGSDYINITANLYGRGCLRYETPFLEVSETDIEFTDTYVGSVSEEWITIKNVGCFEAYFRIETSGDDCFTVEGFGGENVNTTLKIFPSNIYLAKIKFAPETSGNFTANILINGLNCNDVNLLAHGKAISIGDVLKIEPDNYDFGIGVCNWKCSNSKNFTIYNSGSETINFTLSIRGKDASDFLILEGEGDQSLPPNSYINAEVQFCPKSGGGQKEAFLTIEPYSPKANNLSAKLVGMSLIPCQFNLTPLQYDFGSQLLNSCSDEVNFTLTHISGDQARISISLEGDVDNFTITEKPEGLFPLHSSRAIKVKYCPKSVGNHTAYLVITPDICKGLSAVLIGKGEEPPPPAPKFEIIPSSFDFGEVYEKTCSEPQNFTVRNIGNADGYISVEIIGDDAFKIVSQTGAYVIPPGSWHSFTLEFCPEKQGNFEGKLWIHTEWAGGDVPDVYATLSGKGIKGFDGEFSPSEIDFGEVLVGECSGEKELTLINTGNLNITVYIHLEDKENFTITSGAGSHYLMVNEEYPIKVRFCPTKEGELSTSIIATPEGFDIYPTASLKGIGREQCDIEIQPSSYNFGEVYIGESSNTKFKIKNTGKGRSLLNLSIQGVDAESFLIEGNSSFSLSSGSESEITITFKPASEGEKQAFLLIYPDACSYDWAVLRGAGKEKPLCMLNVSPANINFGSIPIHSCSENHTIIVTNIDSVETHIKSVGVEGNPEHFSWEGALGPLPSRSSSVFHIKFCPSSVGNFTSSFVVKSDNCTIGARVFLQGNAVESESEPVADPDPPAINPIPGRWYAIGAVKSTQSPGYGMIISHCPKSKWLAYPNNPVYIFYLDHRGCLWMRDISGKLHIYNLYNGKQAEYNIGSGTPPLFALGEVKSNGDRIEFCYWSGDSYIVVVESAWDGEIWAEFSYIASWAPGSLSPNMMYWFPPYYLLLNEAYNMRLAYFSPSEGFIKTVAIDWIPQYATRTDDGRIWINSERANILASFNSELEEERTITFSSSRTLNGIARNSHGDIVTVDTTNKELIILLAEECYNKIYTIWMRNIQAGTSRWDGGYCLLTTSDIPFLGVHLEDFAKGTLFRAKSFGGEINNLNLRGDAGLLSYSTWKWSWKPDTKAIESFLDE